METREVFFLHKTNLFRSRNLKEQNNNANLSKIISFFQPDISKLTEYEFQLHQIKLNYRIPTTLLAAFETA